MKGYVRTLAEMEEEFGKHPGMHDKCPLCKRGGGDPHADDCPWLLWAKSPMPERAA